MVGAMASVVISARERPLSLDRCLASLRALDHPRFEIPVVDNDPVSDATRQAVARHEGMGIPVHHLCERRRGLGASHNRALETARGSVPAFTDDVVVDANWLRALATPFVRHAGVATTTPRRPVATRA